MGRAHRWEKVQAWLESSDGDWFVDSAVLGELPAYEADEVLEDYGLEVSGANLRELGRRVDAALRAVVQVPFEGFALVVFVLALVVVFVWNERSQMSWQNLEEKPRGSFVRNVHPCNIGRMPDGVVLGEDGLGNLSVRTGRGSHVYGPAVNWAPVDVAPEWLERAAVQVPWLEVGRCALMLVLLALWVGGFTGALLLADRGHGRHDEEVQGMTLEAVEALNERSWVLALTGAELVVLDGLVRDLELYSPARRTLRDKVRARTAQLYRAREDAYSDV